MHSLNKFMRKGSIMDLLFLCVIAFIFGLGVIVSYHIVTQINATATLGTDATYILTKSQTAIGTFNYGFLIIFFGLGIATIIFAFMIPSHPIFIISGLLTLVVLMIIIPIYSNAFESITTSPELSTAAASFGMMNYVMSELPLFSAVIGVIILIVMFIKWRGQGTE